MKTLIIALKAIGVGILAFLSIPLTLFLIYFVPELCTRSVDPEEIVDNESFQQLHYIITRLTSNKNIAVLPRDEYIVVDGLVVNLVKRTFGNEPELGFYQTYYDEGNKHKFSSIDSLLTPYRLDSASVYKIATLMKANKVADVSVNHKAKAIYYRWKVSEMHGEEGIVYYEEKVNKDSLNFKLFEKINSHFYHFAR